MAKGWRKQNHLTAHERQAMPKSDFALPGKGEGPKGAGAGSYPIPDEGHARAALSRVSANGSTEEKSKVRAAVERKYPDIEQRASKLYGKKRVRSG
jgi:hypothetical protein